MLWLKQLQAAALLICHAKWRAFTKRSSQFWQASKAVDIVFILASRLVLRSMHCLLAISAITTTTCVRTTDINRIGLSARRPWPPNIAIQPCHGLKSCRPRIGSWISLHTWRKTSCEPKAMNNLNQLQKTSSVTKYRLIMPTCSMIFFFTFLSPHCSAHGKFQHNLYMHLRISRLTTESDLMLLNSNTSTVNLTLMRLQDSYCYAICNSLIRWQKVYAIHQAAQLIDLPFGLLPWLSRLQAGNFHLKPDRPLRQCPSWDMY